jgi:UDP-glucose 4-epimerase
VLRLAAVYGPRVKGNYARLLHALKRGWFIPIGPGLNRRTLVYDQDVAAAALLAAQYPQAAGQVFNVTDGTVHQFRDIIAAIASALHKRPPLLQLPLRGTRALVRGAEISLRLFGQRSPLTVAAIDKLVEDVAVKAEKIQRTLDFRPGFDLQRGWRTTVDKLASDVQHAI